MVLVTAVCFVVKRRRMRLAHREATGARARHVDSLSERENSSHVALGRAERLDNAIVRTIPGEEIHVREPPAAYVPAGAASWQGDTEELHVSRLTLQNSPH